MKTQDGRLLRQYVDNDSDAAFAELVDRHLQLTYAACMRELNDSDLAGDAAQVTFLLLSRKARSLRKTDCVASWLFGTARNVARTLRRQETRRRHYEEAVVKCRDAETSDYDDALAERIDAALASLSKDDLRLISLRFYQEMSLAEIGGQLGVSEDAARKRVSRVVERLRRRCLRLGTAATAVAIIDVLGGHAAQAVPIGLAASVKIAVAGGSAASSTTVSLIERMITLMKLSQLKLACGVAAAVLVGGGFTAAVIRSAGAGTPPSTPVVSPAAHKLPSPNAFDYYMRAAALRKNGPVIDNFGQGASEADKRASLAANASALQTARDGFAYEYWEPYSSLKVNTRFKQYASLRQVARLLIFESRSKAAAGDNAGAVDAAIDAIKLGTDIDHGGPLITALVGRACASLGRKEAWGLIDRLTTAEATSAARRLFKIDATSATLADIYLWEEQVCLADNSATQPASWQKDYKQLLDFAISEASKPYPNRASLTSYPLTGVSPDISGTVDTLKQFPVSDADERAQTAMLTIALALQAYRAANGAHPARLDELVPKYLDSIPSDPFTASSSLLYNRTAGGYTLYSIGPDGIDNGGTPIVTVSPTDGKRIVVSAESQGDIVAGITR